MVCPRNKAEVLTGSRRNGAEAPRCSSSLRTQRGGLPHITYIRPIPLHDILIDVARQALHIPGQYMMICTIQIMLAEWDLYYSGSCPTSQIGNRFVYDLRS